MNYIKLLDDIYDEKEEYDLKEFELYSNKKYQIIEEIENYYIIKNEFGKKSKYDKDMFNLYLNKDEILLKDIDDLRCYHNAINERGARLEWPKVDTKAWEHLEIISDDDNYILIRIQQPEEYLEFKDLIKIVNAYGFNFKISID